MVALARLAMAIGAVACLTMAVATGGCHPRPKIALGGEMSGSIGHSACAMLAHVTITVVDATGAPVKDGEIWSVEEFDAVPPVPARATRLGRSDVSGRYVTSHCYASADEIDAWQREAHPTRLSYLVLHDVHGVRRATVEPPLTEVYGEADVRTSRLGRAINRGYELAVRVAF